MWTVCKSIGRWEFQRHADGSTGLAHSHGAWSSPAKATCSQCRAKVPAKVMAAFVEWRDAEWRYTRRLQRRQRVEG